jgi:hypothetical protein
MPVRPRSLVATSKNAALLVGVIAMNSRVEKIDDMTDL